MREKFLCNQDDFDSLIESIKSLQKWDSQEKLELQIFCSENVVDAWIKWTKELELRKNKLKRIIFDISGLEIDVNCYLDGLEFAEKVEIYSQK